MDIKDAVLSAARSVGLDDPLLTLYYEVQDNAVDLPVDEDIRTYEHDGPTEGTVLFPLVETGKHAWTYISSILAHAFRARGYRPLILVCDGEVPFCARRYRRGENGTTCSKCTYKGTRILDAFGLDYLTLSDTLPADYSMPDIEVSPDDVDYCGVTISDYARASTRQVLLKYHIDYDDSEEGGAYAEFVRSAAVLVDGMEALLDAYDVDYVMGSRPFYVYEGMLMEMAHDRGVDVRPYTSSGFRSDRIIVGDYDNRHVHPNFAEKSFVEDAIAEPLSPEQEDEIDEIMEGRRDGSEIRVHYTESASESVTEFVDSDNVLLGMFTNVLWDGALEVQPVIYEGLLEWVSETLDHVGGTDGVELVIKTHPGEVGRTKESMYDWIRETHGPLADNVVLLPPDTDIDTYKLIEDLDAGLIYNSTVGLEMAYYGKPVVLAGFTHYRDLGFTFDAETRSEYEALIDDAGDLEMTGEMQALARRYAHFMLVRKQIEFPYFSVEGFGNQEFNPVSHDDLTPGNANIDAVVENVTAGEPVVSKTPTELSPRPGD